MLIRAIAFVCALLLAPFASAQDLPSSRLDTVQKSGKLRVCTPGDYTPFALQKAEGSFEGLDVDLVQSAAKALGVQAEFVKSAWPTLMKDFIEKCDVAVGGISVTLDRQKTRVLLATPTWSTARRRSRAARTSRSSRPSPTSTSRT